MIILNLCIVTLFSCLAYLRRKGTFSSGLREPSMFHLCVFSRTLRILAFRLQEVERGCCYLEQAISLGLSEPTRRIGHWGHWGRLKCPFFLWRVTWLLRTEALPSYHVNTNRLQQSMLPMCLLLIATELGTLKQSLQLFLWEVAKLYWRMEELEKKIIAKHPFS